MKDLDVVYVYRDLGPTAGGLAIDVRNLANGLAKHGWRVGVAYLAEAGAPHGFDPKVELLPVNQFARRLAEPIGLASGVSSIVRRARICHVFSLLPVHFHFAAIAAARRRRIPIVLTPMMHPSRKALWRGYGKYALMAAFDAIAPHVVRWVDVVAAATDDEAAFFRGLGAEVVFLPPAIDIDEPVARSDVEAFKRKYELGQHVVLVGAQRDERRKGMAFALSTFDNVRSRIPDATLAILGMSKVSDRSSSSSSSVRFLGRVPDEEVKTAIAAADVVFVPSLYEAFSRMVIEAWEQQRAVVVTDGVALAPVVGRIGGGRVVQRGDAIGAGEAIFGLLMSDGRLAGELGRKAVEEMFSTDAIVSTAIAHYSRLLADAQ